MVRIIQPGGSSIESTNTDAIGGALVIMGLLLIILGAGLLVYLAIYMFKVLDEPNSIALVALIFDSLREGDKLLFGSLGNGPNGPFEISLGEPMRTFLFIFIVVWVLGAFARILTSLIGAGRELVNTGRQKTR